jgi:hypothetical protein
MKTEEKINYSLEAIKTLQEVVKDKSIAIKEYSFDGVVAPSANRSIDELQKEVMAMTGKISVEIHATLLIELESLVPSQLNE